MRLIDADELKKHIQANAKIYAETKFPLDVIIDNAPTVELFCSYLSDGEVRQPCVEGPCKHEYPFYQEAYQTGYEEGKNARPQGEWKHIVEEDNDVECPFCGFQEDGIYYNFCPSCGADMRGELNETD